MSLLFTVPLFLLTFSTAREVQQKKSEERHKKTHKDWHCEKLKSYHLITTLE